MKSLQIISLLLVLCLATFSMAYADCYKDGKKYPTGTILDGLKCTANGQWVKA